MCLLTALLSPLAMVPLELQRLIVNEATSSRDVKLLAVLGLASLATAIVQGGLKYALNIQRGIAIETVARDLRRRILQGVVSPVNRRDDGNVAHVNAGKVVSMLACESEAVAGFAADAVSLPLLQGGTALFVLGYLIWLEPPIAALALVLYFPQGSHRADHPAHHQSMVAPAPAYGAASRPAGVASHAARQTHFGDAARKLAH